MLLERLQSKAVSGRTLVRTHSFVVYQNKRNSTCACVCGEGVSVCHGRWDGMGREGKVFLDVSFFHSKIRASPANKGRTRQTGRTADTVQPLALDVLKTKKLFTNYKGT